MLGIARDPRHAAVRRVRERVPDSHHRDAASSRGRRRSCCWRSASRSPRSSAGCSRWCSARRPRKRLPHPPALLPVFVHLALVLMLGLYIPPYLADWYRAGGAPDRRRVRWRCEPGSSAVDRRCPARRRRARARTSTREHVARRRADIAAGGGRLVALWGDRDRREARAACALRSLADAACW